jgi:hypothetical protein
MTRTQASAYALLLLTLLALTLIAATVVQLSQLPYDPADLDVSQGPLPFWMWGTIIYSILILALITLYLIHLYSRSGLSGGERALWLFLIVFLNILAMLLYWYLHVRTGTRSEAA